MIVCAAALILTDTLLAYAKRLESYSLNPCRVTTGTLRGIAVSTTLRREYDAAVALIAAGVQPDGQELR